MDPAGKVDRPEVRRYSLRSYHRADDFAGEINVTTIETLTETADGIRVDSHATGIHEGARIDQRETRNHPGVTLEQAHGYRIRHGYTLIAGSSDAILPDAGEDPDVDCCVSCGVQAPIATMRDAGDGERPERVCEHIDRCKPEHGPR